MTTTTKTIRRTNVRQTNELDISIGNKVNQLRLAQGTTRHQLAAKIGVTHQQLQKYEKGTNRVTASRLADLARALAVDVSYFFEEDVLPFEEGQIERQRMCIELMRDFARITRPDQQNAIRRLVKVLVEEEGAE